MGETTIEWTATQLPDGTTLPGFTFNPWIGCQEVSAACDFCYAREFMTRKPRWATAWSGDRFRTSPDYWRQPLKWNREAERSGIRRKVFCASLADVFDNQVDPLWREDLWRLIASTPHLDWLLLTKRPQNIRKMLPADYPRGLLPGWPFPNVWLGTTIENRKEGERRSVELAKVPAVMRFWSCEPLLEDLGDLTGLCLHDTAVDGRPAVGWIITGGESGTGARPSHPDWFRSLRDQCAAAGVPFFFKQWGDWHPHGQALADGSVNCLGNPDDRDKWHPFGDETTSWRVGKKSAGALLDGVAHRGMPL